jgi:Raf kinase inhibitor-like YbhB/YbcL family protein
MRSLRAAWLISILLTFSASAQAAQFTLSSPSIKAGARIPEENVFNGFGCKGGNVAPELQWKNAPTGTQSFAVTVYDPDAPTGSGWWHWLVVNIPADKTGLPRGSGNIKPGEQQTNEGLHTRTDFGAPGWGGPCPPAGDKPHRYIFTVFALKVPKLDVPPDASGALVGFMINANKIGKASFTATYGR